MDKSDKTPASSAVELPPNDNGIGSVEPSYDPVLSARVLLKIDLRLIPLLFVTYNLNFMDKTILSSASVFGLKESTHLHGNQYAWASSIFYFGYLFWAYPTSVLIQRLPIGKYIAANTFFWGAVVAVTGACSNFGGLAALRFLLGVAEATISPAFLYVTSMWYTRTEVPTRVGIWFAGNSMGGAIGSFIAYGIGHVSGGPLEAWRWLFIALGVATFVWGVPMLLLLPDEMAKTRWLSGEEQQCALQRVERDGTGRERGVWCASQVVECVMDPKTYFFFAISLLTQIPNGGTTNFANMVMKGFGFSSLQSTLVQLPSSFVAFFAVLITGRLAGHYRNITTYLIAGTVLFPVVGSALIYTGVARGVKLFGFYLLSTGPAALSLALSLVGVNYKGETKKMTMTALLFVAYCAGNIAGPHFFVESEAPRYQTAFRTIMVCYALVVLIAMGLRGYLAWANRRRAAGEEGEEGDEVGDEELTDWQSVGFRYRM
ncbi:uncharacterized protein K452DRAFT_323006 [Aplosporella prunicola CBS 121167]|uniref:Major facilitator superfamily (MFS) profile domain-containing protein n=1 Tax=Aplosporella prunicola CBS 121167 TaxID=1176127 RepID=A0A6A6AXN2_9PEZI|nr:uncharacterized protein K452DRAFT_323006 [Aplosporella prunicola CBS 121167]KAF2135537.1 hypothetical protein K452DRAFT_323006 [Aplosporella prunicola CBS 121167]